MSQDKSVNKSFDLFDSLCERTHLKIITLYNLKSKKILRKRGFTNNSIQK